MKKNSFVILILGLLIGFVCGYTYYEENLPSVFSSTTESPKLSVCFSPEGQCEKLVLHAINSAEKEILVQCYSFTSKAISLSLMKAYERGIKVKILFDRSQLKAPYSQIHRLTKFGIETAVDNTKGIAHNKVIIIDGKRIITGSYNFSNAANYRNAENMLYVQDQRLANIFKKKWGQRYVSSVN